MRTGVFISFEGIDGVGKSTQLRLVSEKYRSLGYAVVTTREPGGTVLGQRIREMLLDPNQNVSHAAEILLYAADRAQHIKEVILPALKAGKIVLSDRYLDSSVAYQGYGLDQDITWIRRINQWAAADLLPDLTFCLDQDPQTALQRTQGDRIEQRALEYYAKVRQGYQSIAAEEPERFHIINAEGTIEQVFQRIWQIIERRGFV